MKDERYWPVLGTWLKDTAATPPDTEQTARKVSQRLPQTPQVRRRWWLPSLRRNPTPQSDEETTDRFPITTRRTRLMLSPVKAITAGAIVFAISGAFLIAQPFDQHSPVPGAEQGLEPGVTWTHVTGADTGEWVDVETAGASRWDGSVEYQDVAEYIMPMGWSDPRLGETMLVREQAVLHQGDLANWEDDMWVFARAVRLAGPQGAWVGSARGVAANDVSTTQILYEVTGEDAYEGLSAVFAQDNSEWPTVRFDGWIFEGDLPMMPEPVAPPAE